MRRDAKQGATLAARLEDEVQVTVFEVPDPAVYQSRRTARRAAGEVARFEQRDAQAAQRRVTRDARAGDAATNNRHIERLEAQAPAHVFPPRRAISHGWRDAFR